MFVSLSRFVRQALIFAISKIILHVPPYVLMTELQSEILEAKNWLIGKKKSRLFKLVILHVLCVYIPGNFFTLTRKG